MSALSILRPMATNLVLPETPGGMPYPAYGEQLILRANTPRLDGKIYGEQPGRGTQRDMQPGRCVNFDGSGNYVVSTIPEPTYPFTVATWFNKPNTTAGNKSLVAVGDASVTDVYQSVLTDGATIEVQRRDTVNSTVSNTGNLITANTWHHVAVVFQSSTVADVYFDGAFIETQTTAATSVTGIDRALAGTYRIITPGLYSDCKQFDYRIYNSGLTATEVQQLYTQAENALPNKATALHLKLDDTHPTIAWDSGPGKRHGTKTTWVVGTNDYTGSDVPWSWQNERGYTYSDGATYYQNDDGTGLISSGSYLPRLESDKTKCIAYLSDGTRASLQYTGECPQNGLFDQNNCMTFTPNYHVIIPDNAGFQVETGDFTFACRLATTDSSFVFDRIAAYRTDPGNNLGFQFAINSATSLWASTCTTTHTFTNKTINDGAWHSIVFARRSGVLYLYVDGVQYGSSASADNITGDTGYKLYLGINPTGPANGLTGSLCDVRWYNRGFSASEALDYEKRNSISTTNLVGWWKGAEGAGTTIHNSSSTSGLNGTATSISEPTFWGTKQSIFNPNGSEGFDFVGKFDGSTHYVTVADSATFDATTALSVVVRCRSAVADITTNVAIAGKYNTAGSRREWAIFFNTAEKIEIYLSSDGINGNVWTSTSAISVANLNTIGFTYEGGVVLSVYVNGVEQAGSFTTGSLPASLHQDTATFEIGSYAGGSAKFAGIIAEVCYYKSLFSAADHLAIHNSTYDTSTFDAYWNFERHLRDSIGSNHGTLVGSESTFWQRVPAAADGSSLVGRSALSHPATIGHNNCESSIDMTGGVAAPRKRWDRPVNLHALSERFDSWTTKTRMSVIPNAIESFDGTLTMDKLVPDGTNSDHKTSNGNITVAAGTPVVHSCFFKAGEYDWAAIYDVSAGKGKCFNIATGATGANVVGAPDDYGIDLVAPGIYRAWIALTTPSTTCSGMVYISNADGLPAFAGSGTNGIYAGGFQTEKNVTTPGEYTPSDWSDDPPRFAMPNEMLSNTAFSGAVAGTPGTAPTNWTYAASAGTLGVSGANLTFTTTAAQHYIRQTKTVYSRQRIYAQISVTVVSGTVALADILSVTNVSGTAEYFVDGVGALSTATITGTKTVKVRFLPSANGSAYINLGAGVGGAKTQSVTISAPTVKTEQENPDYSRITTKSGVPWKADRITRYDRVLIGSRNDAAEKYTQDVAL